LQLKNSYRICDELPNEERAIEFYEGLKVAKGNVYKAIVKD
jgi:hypothetical protein